MSLLKFIALGCVSLAATSASPAVDNVGADCTITSFSQVSSVTSSCTSVVVSNLDVPAGQTLQLFLKDGATLTFQGTTKWEYAEWTGPLMWIRGKKIIVQGASGSALDGQGALYWDGKGGSGGVTKPQFLTIQATGGSVVRNINMKNCPETCVGITGSNLLTFSKFNIDNSAGDANQLARNTDGFDIAQSSNIHIDDSVVKNQDDCICVNSGKNLYFSNMHCSGSHGLSVAAGVSTSSYDLNTVSNVTFHNCVVVNAMLGIHVKTEADGGQGVIDGLTYQNIQMTGISDYGIQVNQNYRGGGGSGDPVGNVPIKGLKLSNVYGTVTGQYSTKVNILCASGACTDFQWSSVALTGGANPNSCNYEPSGFTC